MLHLMIVQTCGSGGDLPFSYDHIVDSVAAVTEFQLKVL